MLLHRGYFLRETPPVTLTPHRHPHHAGSWYDSHGALCHIRCTLHPVLCNCCVHHQYDSPSVYSVCCSASPRDGQPRGGSGGRGSVCLVPHFTPRTQHYTHSRCPINTCGCRFDNYLPAPNNSWFSCARFIPMELVCGLPFLTHYPVPWLCF